MKLILVVVSLVLSWSTFADDFAKSIGVEEVKAAKFLKEKGPCHVARGMKMVSKEGSYLYPEMICIVDGVFGQGTINETGGCAAVKFNLKNGQSYPLGRNEFGQKFYVMAPKECNKGGFKELLRMATITENKKTVVTVLESIRSGKGTEFQGEGFFYYSDDNLKKIIESK